MVLLTFLSSSISLEREMNRSCRSISRFIFRWRNCWADIMFCHSLLDELPPTSFVSGGLVLVVWIVLGKVLDPWLYRQLKRASSCVRRVTSRSFESWTRLTPYCFDSYALTNAGYVFIKNQTYTRVLGVPGTFLRFQPPTSLLFPVILTVVQMDV